MTSTVLDVTVLLLCVSASVVALGGADAVGTGGPSADEAADRLVTETVTVRYRTAESTTDTRTVHATRAELLALLVERSEGTGGGRAADRNRDEAVRDAFASRATAAVAAGLDGRTRIDATIPRAASQDHETSLAVAVCRVPDRCAGRRAAGAIAASGAPTVPRTSMSGASPTRNYPRRTEEDRSVAAEEGETVTVGPEPPRNVDVETAVVTHPSPDGSGIEGSVRIVVRRW